MHLFENMARNQYCMVFAQFSHNALISHARSRSATVRSATAPLVHGLPVPDTRYGSRQKEAIEVMAALVRAACQRTIDSGRSFSRVGHA
jgi:hypothetical protein